jgi:hypothetical protein
MAFFILGFFISSTWQPFVTEIIVWLAKIHFQPATISCDLAIPG